MELDQLKDAWNKYSDSQTSRHRLDETELHRLLKRRTKGLMDRIDRNVRVGFVIVFALVLFFVLDEFVLTPSFAEGAVVPAWLFVIDALNAIFLLGTFIFFWAQYRSVKKYYSQSSDMRRALRSTIDLLSTYRRLFYWALIVLLVVISVSFLTGLVSGFEMAASRQGVNIEDLNRKQMIGIFAGGIVILLSAVTVLFFLFRWGFRRLFGRYIQQLEDTLAELDEIE